MVPAKIPGMVAFFIPRASDDEQAERLYDAFAEFAGCAPAPPRERVRSISFTTHGGAEWVAEVGEELRGRRTTRLLRRGEVVEHTRTLSSTSRVLAVYPGSPFTVVTDAQPITSAPSEWANPFTAEPDTVTFFGSAEAASDPSGESRGPGISAPLTRPDDRRAHTGNGGQPPPCDHLPP